MSLEKKDLRVYLDPDVHRLLLRLADRRRVEPARLIEKLVSEHVMDELHAAIALLKGEDVAGFDRMRPDAAGLSRTPPDSAGSTSARRRG